jgi:nucleoside-diphosphate-sugar epimerase
MQVVITGGAGMLGKKLAHALLKRGSLAGKDGKPQKIDRLVLLDTVAAPDLPQDSRVEFVKGDVFDPALVRRFVTKDTGSIFHFAGVVSSGAEADFDLGYRVNLDGTRAVLEAARATGTCPRIVYTSSVAVFGGALPQSVGDDQRLTPQTSYGAQKAIGELLVADYTRKGFIDGRSVRPATVVVRPGRPNLAASTFASSIIREPLAGQPVVCPVAPETKMNLISVRRTVEAFIHAHDLPASAWGSDRAVQLPTLPSSVAEMAEALKRIGGQKAYDLIKWQIDPNIVRIVETWPKRQHAPQTLSMGFKADSSVEEIIRYFIDDDLPAQLKLVGS